MFNEKFMEVVSKEGVVSIVSWTEEDGHVVNTWNSYLQIIDNKILIPAYGMRHTQKNTDSNPNVKLTLGSKEVMGHRSMGAGFLVKGTAEFIDQGEEFEMTKDKFSFANRVMIVTVDKVIQTI